MSHLKNKLDAASCFIYDEKERMNPLISDCKLQSLSQLI